MYITLCSEFRDVISPWKRCSVRLYFHFFVGWFMSYLRDLCLFVYSGVQHILTCAFVLLVFVVCTICCQFLWIVLFFWPFGILYRLFTKNQSETTVCYLWSVIMCKSSLSLFVILMIDTSISTSETTKIQIQISYDAAKGVTTVARTRYLLSTTLYVILGLTGWLW